MIIGTHKTTTRLTDKGVSCVYHQTEVVKETKNKVILNNGGWWTPTTKKRMNQVSEFYSLGFKVYQKNFDWFVDFEGKTYEFLSNKLILNKS